MKEKLISTLEELDFPVMLQGSLGEENEYPDSFITFWCDDTEDNQHFDNDAHATYWTFSVIFYSNNPILVNTVPSVIRALLKGAGFIPQGKGNDIPSDEPTHTGWAMEFIGTEEINL